MATSRSPNYPAVDLPAALGAIKVAYKAEGRSKMARSVLAHHLGYTSLNGRALAKIGAIRAYGLIEGREDELRVSGDAIVCMEAPDGSFERAEALARCSSNPPIFKEISAEYATLPSEQNLRFFLIKKGFTSEAAGKAASNYLATMRFTSESGGAYSAMSPTSMADIESEGSEDIVSEKIYEEKVVESAPARPAEIVRTGSSEREYMRGSLSKNVSYRLIVDGELGPKQIGKLIKLLEAQKAVLDDDDDDHSDIA